MVVVVIVVLFFPDSRALLLFRPEIERAFLFVCLSYVRVSFGCRVNISAYRICSACSGIFCLFRFVSVLFLCLCGAAKLNC